MTGVLVVAAGGVMIGVRRVDVLADGAGRHRVVFVTAVRGL